MVGPHDNSATFKFGENPKARQNRPSPFCIGSIYCLILSIMDVDEEDANQSEMVVLEGKLANVKWLVDALSCIYSPAHKGQDVTITVHSEGGLRFSVEHTGVLQASVIVPKIAFSTFTNTDESVRLRLNLSLIMECLNLFAMGSATSASGNSAGGAVGGGAAGGGGGGGGTGSGPVSAHIWFMGEGTPLCIRLWDGDAQTECKLTTLAFEDDDDLNTNEMEFGLAMGFYDHQVISSAVIDSETLRDAIAELDYCGATTAEIRISPSDPHFILCSPADSVDSQYDGLGNDALCAIQLPNPNDRSSEAFHAFQCNRTQCSVYKLPHLRRCKQGLSLSETCKLQMNSEGMLSIVCKMRGLDSDRILGAGLERCFVEFVIVAQEIDEDEDEDQENQHDQNVDNEDRDEDDGEDDRDRDAMDRGRGGGNMKLQVSKRRQKNTSKRRRDIDDEEDFDEDGEVAGTPHDEDM